MKFVLCALWTPLLVSLCLDAFLLEFRYAQSSLIAFVRYLFIFATFFLCCLLPTFIYIHSIIYEMRFVFKPICIFPSNCICLCIYCIRWCARARSFFLSRGIKAFARANLNTHKCNGNTCTGEEKHICYFVNLLCSQWQIVYGHSRMTENHVTYNCPQWDRICACIFVSLTERALNARARAPQFITLQSI